MTDGRGERRGTRSTIGAMPLVIVTVFLAAASIHGVRHWRGLDGPVDSEPGMRFRPLVAQVSPSDVPPRGRISFIGDRDSDSWPQAVERYRLQAISVPRIVTAQPNAKIAVVDCSSDSVSEQRLQHFQYRWLVRTEPGRGLAVRVD